MKMKPNPHWQDAPFELLVFQRKDDQTLSIENITDCDLPKDRAPVDEQWPRRFAISEDGQHFVERP